MKRFWQMCWPALRDLCLDVATLVTILAGLLTLVLVYGGGKIRAGWGPAGCAAVVAPAAGFTPGYTPGFTPGFAPAPAFTPVFSPAAPVPPAPTLAPAPAVTSPGYCWISDGAGGQGLFQGEQQVGWLDARGRYYPRLGQGRFAEAAEPPLRRPSGYAAPAPEKGCCPSSASTSTSATASKRGHCCGASGCQCDPDDCPCGKTRGLCCDGCSCALLTSEKAEFSPPVVQNFGVEVGKLATRPRWTLNGREVSRAQAFEAVSASDKIPDDAGRVRLTVIGGKADREQVVKDLATHPALAPFKDKLSVQAYDPADPMIEGLKFPTAGLTLLVQRPDGTVIGRNHSGKYAGAEELALALPGAMRRADSDYDPAKDPDLKKPEPPPPPPPAPAPAPTPSPTPASPWVWLGLVPPQAWLLAGLGGLLFILTLTRRSSP